MFTAGQQVMALTSYGAMLGTVTDHTPDGRCSITITGNKEYAFDPKLCAAIDPARDPEDHPAILVAAVYQYSHRGSYILVTRPKTGKHPERTYRITREGSTLVCSCPSYQRSPDQCCKHLLGLCELNKDRDVCEYPAIETSIPAPSRVYREIAADDW